MESQRLQYLLHQLNAGTCTGKELEEINEWFHNIDHGHADINTLIEKNGGSEQLAGELFNNFQARNKKPAKTRSFVLYYKLAAAAVFAATIIGAYLYTNRSTKPAQQPAMVQRSGSITPGSNKAILTLADGSTITLDNAANGQLAQQGHANIIKQRDGQLIYDQVAELSGKPLTMEHAPLTFNTLVIPRGGQYQLTLPDGTKVWLNAATRLRYPVHFAANERRVELTGEAYFEVAHNAAQPFLVVSAKQEIKVLGTHFNVKAYDDEAATRTTLLEGSVRVTTQQNNEQAILKPGQQANVLHDRLQLKVSKTSVDEAVAWKSGYFLFDNQDIRTIMKMISRWYDVDVEYGAMRQEEFLGGSFSRTANIQELLNNLEAISHTHFTIKERRIIVSN